MNKSRENYSNEKAKLVKYHSERAAPTDKVNTHEIRQQKKKDRKVQVIERYTCKKAPYEGGRMEAPDGTLLSFTDLKKSQWYLQKGLATLISEEPYTVRLNFEPSGRNQQGDEAWVDDQYYCTNRENKCVVCGHNENFLRFHVVPTLYRSHFPDSLKSHRSHDVLLMCFDCHNKASRHQDNLKNSIAKQYGCPL